jgi:hypothetical protein
MNEDGLWILLMFIHVLVGFLRRHVGLAMFHWGFASDLRGVLSHMEHQLHN